ncbi:MAG: hypothetical protein GXY48_08165 [Methanomicrobiales archaeon]|nr:hypothetical protein [Methanomicrobiales archaeon]
MKRYVVVTTAVILLSFYIQGEKTPSTLKLIILTRLVPGPIFDNITTGPTSSVKQL